MLTGGDRIIDIKVRITYKTVNNGAFPMQLPQSLLKYQDVSPERKDRRLIKGATGTFYDVFNFRPWMINLHDIATSLSKKCRWNGMINIDGIFTIAQHSVYVSRIMGPKPEYRLMGLLHDASEGPMVDMITPMKRELPDFVDVEDHIQTMIYNHFDLSITPEMDKALHAADRLVLEWEANQFDREWDNMQTDRKIFDVFPEGCLDSAAAKKLFIAEFNSVVSEILTR